MKNIHIGHFLGLAALVLAIAAAFFSVTGLSQLFAGASLAVIIMASALEFSKIFVASFLHNYWNEITKALKTYLVIALIVLVTITSAGIYGFLSSAYQATANGLEIQNNQIGLVDTKIDLYQNKISDNKSIINSKLERYNKLADLRDKQEVRLDSMISKRYFSNANKTREEISIANTEMSNLQSEIDVINNNNTSLNDSISKLELSKLEMKSNSEISGEVGPLIYLSELTGVPMDSIINIMILVLIFVFDPLAISLVIATNWIFKKKNTPKPSPSEDVQTEPDVNEIEVNDAVVVEKKVDKEQENNEGQSDLVDETTEKKTLSDVYYNKNKSVTKLGDNKYLEDKHKLIFKRDKNGNK